MPHSTYAEGLGMEKGGNGRRKCMLRLAMLFEEHKCC